MKSRICIKLTRNQWPIAGILFFVLFAAAFASNDALAAQAKLPLYSPLRSPIAVPNPKWIFSSTGGLRFCDVETGQVWINFPAGFTSESGAEIHCDVNPTTNAVTDLNKRLFANAFKKRGYLIGIYPNIPFARSVQMQFKLESRDVKANCRNKCFVGKYYDVTRDTWFDLPTSFDPKTRLVSINIGKSLPRTEYPAYPDRFLIALFVK